ncbi:MAG: hypothetical protein JO005_12580 [Gammaproteobacteria bacterium]|nr:hypothetical protein [Gammaproteobacteria bacterium]
MAHRARLIAAGWLAVAGCAHQPPTPPAPQAPAPAVTPVAAPAAAAPTEASRGESSNSPAAAAAAQPPKKTPAPPRSAGRPKPIPPPGSAATPPTAAAAPSRPAPPALDLVALEDRLRSTKAIGVFTKLSLKNEVDALLGAFREFHRGAPSPTLPQLRQRYDLLLMKVLSLLQDGDPSLASAIGASREAIWAVLIDPKSFAKLAA